MSETERHLDLLGTLYYVLGSATCAIGLLPVLHIAIGGLLLSGDLPVQNTEETIILQFMGAFFAGLGILFFAAAQAFGVLFLLAGRKLRQRRSLMFCQISAAVACLWVPFGTALGVYSLIILNKPEVHTLFTSARLTSI